ncbi:U4/U6 small nuclear ribonucleoprotein Prp31-like [Chenopodium quinoa]|uniref:U4/U6 small nuclear ribonucleoprotein Prp31-like n=1 Tax=Chenopodium quinoa TaxID=63459 RepID=UPI000B793572|nr:U4/U6 small nuclear ribonucleoprotein Prp31-like [Chenopodium quinoa]
MVKIEDSLYILYAFIRDNYGRNIPEVESLVAHPIDYVRAVKDAGFEIVDGACDQVLDLVSLRKRLLDFVDNRMVYIAPNLSAIVGATVAAKLMVAAGGLELLGKMTACNVQLLGSQRRNLDGLSTRLHFGCLQESDILQTFPSALTIGASSVLASACSTAARVDSMGNDLTGNTGKNLREVVVNKINRYCNAGREHSDLRTNIAEGAPDSKALAGLS